MEPLEVVQAFDRAWGDHDLDATLAWCTDDCVFESTGPSPDGVRSQGHAELREVWGPIFEDRAARFTGEETFVAGDRVVHRWRYDWGDGHVRGVDIFRVEDGKVAEKLSYVKG